MPKPRGRKGLIQSPTESGTTKFADGNDRRADHARENAVQCRLLVRSWVTLVATPILIPDRRLTGFVLARPSASPGGITHIAIFRSHSTGCIVSGLSFCPRCPAWLGVFQIRWDNIEACTLSDGVRDASAYRRLFCEFCSILQLFLASIEVRDEELHLRASV